MYTGSFKYQNETATGTVASMYGTKSSVQKVPCWYIYIHIVTLYAKIPTELFHL